MCGARTQTGIFFKINFLKKWLELQLTEGSPAVNLQFTAGSILGYLKPGLIFMTWTRGSCEKERTAQHWEIPIE